MNLSQTDIGHVWRKWEFSLSKGDRSPKIHSQNIATFKPFPSYSNFTFTFVTCSCHSSNLSTRLAVILNFLYMCCYGVLITKQFNWQASEAQCFDCNKSVHAHCNFKHWNNKPSIKIVYKNNFSPIRGVGIWKDWRN